MDGSGDHRHPLRAPRFRRLIEVRLSCRVVGQLQADVWENDIEELLSMAISDAFLEVSPTDNAWTLSGRIPGITGKSRLYFGAYDFLRGNDAISCHP